MIINIFYLKDIVNGFFKEDVMEVLSIEEQKDGSAIVTLNMTEEENNLLVQYAVVNILKEEMEKVNEQGTDGNRNGLQSEESLERKDL